MYGKPNNDGGSLLHGLVNRQPLMRDGKILERDLDDESKFAAR